MYWDEVKQKNLEDIYQYLVKLWVFFNIPQTNMLCHKFIVQCPRKTKLDITKKKKIQNRKSVSKFV
jgi:hypothetical protein